MATDEQQTSEATGIGVENPATGRVVRTVSPTPPDDVPSLVKHARDVQPAWEALGFDGRARILRRAQKWVIDNAERIVETIVSETGKTYEDAFGAEVVYAANSFGFWAKRAPQYLADEKVRSSNPVVLGRKLIVRYRPVGVVGVIGPWNYPLTNSFGDCIPALAAGNAVILKPSEVTPLTSLLLADALRECGMPDGVFAVATGRGETGAALVDEVDLVNFTGSTATGRKIMARAAQTLTQVSLELGGKDPMIVLADADLERAANLAVYYSMFNGGQTCISIERVYVEEPVYDDFVRRVTEKVGALRQGPSTGPATAEVGAMTFPKQLEIVEEHVRDALAKGARALTGGKRRAGKGDFYEPTVLVDVDHTMKAMTEETFGPTLPIMKVADADEAVTLANDSPYGLGAAVLTGDRARGEQIARRLQAGAVCVNDALLNYVAVELPMGGWKSSGLGTRHGGAGIRKFTKQQSLFISRVHLKRDLYAFPYKPRTSKALFKGLRLIYGRGRRR